MVEILSQAEIEALLSSLSDSPSEEIEDYSVADTAPMASVSAAPSISPVMSDPRAGVKRTIAYEPYDFRRPDKFSKEQLRTLQMVHETFARLFASSLSAYLRVSTHIDLISVEQVPYDEYVRSLSASIINIFAMPPLAGQAILEMEFNIILSMIDRLLGGPGNMIKNSTVLTEIEKALSASIVSRGLKDLKTAWEGVAQFNPRRESTETQAQFVQIVPPNDIVVSILFEVKVGELRGAMSLCIPYLLLKPIINKLSAQRWFPTTAKKAGGQNMVALARRLQTAKVNCVCRLGTSQITVNDLLKLKVGDTVMLDRRSTDEVDLLIGGSVKFSGKPGIAGRKVALHINRVVGERMQNVR